MSGKKRLLWLFLSLLFLVSASLLCACHWIYRKFDEVSIEQIAYHLIFPLTGVDRAYYFSFARNFSVGILAAAAYAFLLHRALSLKSTCRVKPRVMGWILSVMLVCVAGFSLGYMEYRYGAIAFIKRTFVFDDSESTYFAENYSPVRPRNVSFPNGRNNLVLLIMESTESAVNRGGGGMAADDARTRSHRPRESFIFPAHADLRHRLEHSGADLVPQRGSVDHSGDEGGGER